MGSLIVSHPTRCATLDDGGRDSAFGSPSLQPRPARDRDPASQLPGDQRPPRPATSWRCSLPVKRPEPRSRENVAVGLLHAPGKRDRLRGPAGLSATARTAYRSLWQRLTATNAVLLVAGCALTTLVLAPSKFSSVALDEALVVLGAVVAVSLVNTVVVRRFLKPLQALTALARQVDLDRPGQRIPDARANSEAGEIAVTFNEMLDRLELERRESTRRVLGAHEAERLRVAQELHDEVGQTLTALLLQLSRLQGRLPHDLGLELNEAQDVARASLEDVRRIATDLRPEALEELGLPSALATLCDGFGRRAGLRVERKIELQLAPLSDEQQLVIYRVAQEALTNVARHAGTDAVDLALESNNDRILLTVRDHGRGFAAAHAADGRGIRGMRERAALVGATLEIEAPAVGTGTLLRLYLPLSGASLRGARPGSRDAR